MKKRTILLALLAIVAFTGCTVVGNSPMERKHRRGLPSTENLDGVTIYSNYALN